MSHSCHVYANDIQNKECSGDLYLLLIAHLKIKIGSTVRTILGKILVLTSHPMQSNKVSADSRVYLTTFSLLNDYGIIYHEEIVALDVR